MTQTDVEERFDAAVRSGDVAEIRRIGQEDPRLTDIIDQARFDFDSPALVYAARHRDRDLVDALLDVGADPDARSGWAAGPYGALHSCVDGPTATSLALAHHLVDRGATVDLHAGAGLDRFDVVTAVLDEAPGRVNEPGPDGATALHLAASPRMAALLIDRGADLEQRCVDHRSTPIMWSVDGRLDVTRYLLEAGARPDLFIAAVLDDAGLVETIVASDPGAIGVAVRPGRSHAHLGYGDKYVWALDFADTPHEVARRRGHDAAYTALVAHSPPPRRLVEACRRGDVDEVRSLLGANPGLASRLDGFDAREALLGHATTTGPLVEGGLNPDHLDPEGGTALHHAAWRGDLAVARALLEHGARRDIIDDTHGSTPAGWAEYNGRSAMVDLLQTFPTSVRRPTSPE